jgi:hypothetical protein
MEKDHTNHEVTTEAVDISHQVAKRDIPHNLQHRCIRLMNRGDVVDHQDNTGDRFQDKEVKAQPPHTQGVPPRSSFFRHRSRADMIPKAVAMYAHTGVWAWGRVAAERLSPFIPTHTGKK